MAKSALSGASKELLTGSDALVELLDENGKTDCDEQALLELCNEAKDIGLLVKDAGLLERHPALDKKDKGLLADSDALVELLDENGGASDAENGLLELCDGIENAELLLLKSTGLLEELEVLDKKDKELLADSVALVELLDGNRKNGCDEKALLERHPVLDKRERELLADADALVEPPTGGGISVDVNDGKELLEALLTDLELKVVPGSPDTDGIALLRRGGATGALNILSSNAPPDRDDL